MIVTATFASLTVLFAVLLGLAFLWVTRPPKCPRCGARDWIPCKHLGPYDAYCRKCAQFISLATGLPPD